MTAPRPRVPPLLLTAAAVTGCLLVVALGVYVLVVALARVWVASMPVFLALLAATVLVPPARWLQRRGLPPL